MRSFHALQEVSMVRLSTDCVQQCASMLHSEVVDLLAELELIV